MGGLGTKEFSVDRCTIETANDGVHLFVVRGLYEGVPLGFLCFEVPDHPDGIGRLHDDQAHYATNAAERAGTIEAAAVWMIFACGKEVSDRVGIDRGNMPPWRDTLDEAATLAAPPAGMEWWKWTMEQPRNHTLGQQANWLEWRDASYWNYINAQMLNGEMGVDEAITRSQQGGDDVMAKFNWEPKPVTQSNYYD